MSYTNHTTNYNLPQYVGTDKPTYLGDFNSAMSAIDAQMKLNADSASTAGTNATTANTNIGTLANLNTTAKTDLVSAINEVNTTAGTAQTTANGANETAGSALSTATSASTGVTNLANYFKMSSTNTYSTTSQYQIVSGGGSIASASVAVARNSAGSLGKVYGYVTITSPTGGASKIKLNVDTGLRPSEKITINGLGVIENLVPSQYGGSYLTNLNVDINTDGTIELYGGVTTNATGYVIRAFACLLFVEDFGDTPQPE